MVVTEPSFCARDLTPLPFRFDMTSWFYVLFY